MASFPAAMTGSGFVAGTPSRAVPARIGFDVDWTPSPVILMKDFAKLGLDIRSFHEPLKRSVQLVVAPSIGRTFEVEGRPEPWPALSEETLAQKQQLGMSGGILVRTSKLKRVAQQLNAWTITRESAVFNNLPGAEYGGFHQSGAGGFTRVLKPRTTGPRELQHAGGSFTSGGLPQRAFAVIQEEDMPKIEEVFQIWIGERAAAAGFAGATSEL